MNDDVGSIYFGGGTPSILTETDLEKILNEIHKKFKISYHAEITIECNPDDVILEKIEVWKKNSFNRVSLGIQSFIDSDLVLMNRSHNSKTAIDSIKKIKNNFTNFSIDLIYGIPESSIDAWKKNIENWSPKGKPQTLLDNAFRCSRRRKTSNHTFTPFRKIIKT